MNTLDYLQSLMDIDAGKPPSRFVRTLLTAFGVLLVAMVLYNYFAIDPQGEISSGLIILLSFLLIIVLSESFDNFSIGKLVTIARRERKTAATADKLERRNADLMAQLISISNSNSQNQNHTNVYGDFHAAASVAKASEEEVAAATEADGGDVPTERQSRKFESAPARVPRIRYDWRSLEPLALSSYLHKHGLNALSVITEAKMTTEFQGIDPVSTVKPIYDAYYRSGDEEVFVEFRPDQPGAMSMIFRDRLYVMLSKIAHYRRVKGVEARLDLVLMHVPNLDDRLGPTMARMLEQFEPAIANGLLRVEEVMFSEEQLAMNQRES
jgi:hypothetical protein